MMSAWWEDEVASLVEQPLQLRRQRPGTRQMHGVDGPDDCVFGWMEADARGLDSRVLRHQPHPAAQQGVSDQHAPDLLHDELGLLAAQHALALLQRLLDLPEPQLDLPALAVHLRQLCCREPARLAQRGDEAPRGACHFDLDQPSLPVRRQLGRNCLARCETGMRINQSPSPSSCMTS